MRALAFVLVVLLSACGPQVGDVACSGALPITCSCAESCSLEADGGLTVVEFERDAGVECVPQLTPRCWRRDR